MIKKLISTYANNLYQDVMRRAYQHAMSDIIDSLPTGGKCPDCCAGGSGQYQRLREISNSIYPENYVGIEWDGAGVLQAKNKDLTLFGEILTGVYPLKTNLLTA